jgi:hypothetical protein
VNAPVFRLRVIGLRYFADTDNNPATPDAAVEPTEREFRLIKSWIERAYPVAQTDIVWRTVDALSLSLKWPFTSGDANSALRAVRKQDMVSGTDKRTHYYGLVADAGGFMRGGADASAVGSGPTGTPGKYANFNWDTDESYGDWYTGHEVGHTFGREHYGVCGSPGPLDTNYEFRPGAFISSTDGAYVGLDMGDAAFNIPAAVLPGRMWTDVMDYCRSEWVSSYTYRAILQRLNEENPPDQNGAIGMLRLRRGKHINVVALVNLARGTGQIKYVNPLPEAPEAVVNAENEALIRLRRADGKLLGEFPVALKRQSDTPADEDQMAIVDAAIPHISGARILELILGGKVIDTFRAGGSSPSLRNLRVPSLRTLADVTDAPLTLNWEGADADNDRLTYIVQVSSDEGKTWETLAIGLTRTSLPVEIQRLRSIPSLKYRVIATDGFNRTMVTSRSLRLPSR